MTVTRAERMGIVLPPTPGGWDGKSTAGPIVWKEEERYRMLYQGWQDGGGPRLLGLASSRDGLEWEKLDCNPVMTPTAGSWDQNGFECGSLLKLDGEYWLYYSGKGPDGRLRVGLAFSEDLVKWCKYEGNPILGIDPANPWESGGVAFPAVLKGKSAFRMIYGGYGPSSMQLGLASSENGTTWIREPCNPVFRQRGWFADPNCDHWDAGVEVHQVFILGDFFVMFYEGLGNHPHRYNIGAAYSPDCRAWARSPENPLYPLTSPNVKQDMSTVHPWLLVDDMVLYYAEVLGTSTHSPHRICAARVDPGIINPSDQKALSYALWAERRIDPPGDVTAAVPCQPFHKKTFHLLSDQDGLVQIEIDPAGLNRWQCLHQARTHAHKAWAFSPTQAFQRARLRYITNRTSTVSACLALEGI